MEYYLFCDCRFCGEEIPAGKRENLETGREMVFCGCCGEFIVSDDYYKNFQNGLQELHFQSLVNHYLDTGNFIQLKRLVEGVGFYGIRKTS